MTLSLTLVAALPLITNKDQMLGEFLYSQGIRATTVTPDPYVLKTSCDMADKSHLCNLMKEFIGNEPIDFFVVPATTRAKKLLFADMESTMIEQEMFDEIAALVGIGPQIAAITARAMNGEIDFTQSLNERISLLKDQPVALLERAAKTITAMPGARELVAAMKTSGAQCWLVSGGFSFFAEIVAQQLGFDRYFSNELVIEKGVLAGAVHQPVLDKQMKKTLLDRACAELNITYADCLVIGDGANDLAMLNACQNGGGLAVAYHAKPAVRSEIRQQINHTSLSALIHAQGLA